MILRANITMDRAARPLILLCCAAGLLANPALGAGPASKTKPAEVVYPHSLFTDEIGQGSDPFFPQSSRRKPKLASSAAPVARKAQSLLETLNVRGILAGNSDRRLALINGRVFAQGETFDLSVTNGRVRVRCLEIKPASVVLAVEGGPGRYELHMRQD